jgi:putative methionine-R-sulfoxide reductase with GAF domain
MKSVSKNAALGVTILFFLGIAATAYTLLMLPDALQEASIALDRQVLQELQPVLNQTYAIVGCTLITGLAALMLSLSQRSTQQALTVIQKEAQQTGAEDKEEKKSEREEARTKLSSQLQQKLREIDAMQADEAHKLELCLRALCSELEASQGAVYVSVFSAESRFIEMQASYAYTKPDSARIRYEFGEGLPGQTAKEGSLRNISNIPDGQINIASGLGKASPKHLLLVPVLREETVVGVVEMASFTAFSKAHEQLVSTTFGQYAEEFGRLAERLQAQHSQQENQNA